MYFSLDNIEKQVLDSSDDVIKENIIFFTKKKNYKILRVIIELTKIDLNFLDSSGYTPLHHSCYRGFKDITSILLYYGSRNDLLNESNETAIEAGMYALSKNSKNSKNITDCINLIKNFKPIRNISNDDKYISNLRSLINKLSDENEFEINQKIFNIIDKIIYEKKIIEEFVIFIINKIESEKFYMDIYSKVVFKIIDINTDIKHILASILYKKYLVIINEPKNDSGFFKCIVSLYKNNILNDQLIENLIENLINTFLKSLNLDYITLLCNIILNYGKEKISHEKNIKIKKIYDELPSKLFKYKFKLEEIL